MELKYWYNGYCFTCKSESIYNPKSIQEYFYNNGKADEYWAREAHSTFQWDQLTNRPGGLENVNWKGLTSLASVRDINEIDPLTLMFEAGYLTIEKYYAEGNAYTLIFLHREVEVGFIRELMEAKKHGRSRGGFYVQVCPCCERSNAKFAFFS